MSSGATEAVPRAPRRSRRQLISAQALDRLYSTNLLRQLMDVSAALNLRLLAGIELSCPRQRTKLLPQLLTRTGVLNRPCQVAGFVSERWPASARNGGRLRVGIPSRLQSEFARDAQNRRIVRSISEFARISLSGGQQAPCGIVPAGTSAEPFCVMVCKGTTPNASSTLEGSVLRCRIMRRDMPTAKTTLGPAYDPKGDSARFQAHD